MKIFSPILKGTTTVAQGTTNLSGSFTGSLLGTAATASYADNFTVGGTLTAQTINVQIITSSIEFNTGSTRNGSIAGNTHEFTGSVFMSGSLGIGTSSPASGYRTHIVASGSNTFLGISNQGTANGDRTLRIGFGGAGADTYASIQGTRLSVADDVNLVLQPGGGNIGIGQPSPTVLLDLKKAHAAAYNSVVDLINLNGYFPGYDVDSQRAGIQAGVPPISFGNTSFGQIGFATRGSDGYQTRVKVMPDGLRFSGGASSLNYYEEGSWTPSLRGQDVAGTVGYQFRSATYVRIGNYVFVRWGFKINSISGASGTMQISGLPFTSVEWGAYQEPNVGVSTGLLATTDNAFKARVFVRGSGTALEGRLATNSDTGWNINEFSGDEWVIGEIFYNIA